MQAEGRGFDPPILHQLDGCTARRPQPAAYSRDTMASARAMYPPPLFPRTPQQPLIRLQEDLGEIVALDESGSGGPDAPPKP